MGNSPTETPIYTEEANSRKSLLVYEPEGYCFPYGNYVAVLGNRNQGAWDPNSKLTITHNGMIIAVLSWTCGRSKECEIHFSIDRPFPWQYSAIVVGK